MDWLNVLWEIMDALILLLYDKLHMICTFCLNFDRNWGARAHAICFAQKKTMLKRISATKDIFI